MERRRVTNKVSMNDGSMVNESRSGYPRIRCRIPSARLMVGCECV